MVINAVGPVILKPWIDHPNVTTVVWASIGGMEVGNVLVDVMYGAQTPSRRSYHIRSQLSNLGSVLRLQQALIVRLVLRVNWWRVLEEVEVSGIARDDSEWLM